MGLLFAPARVVCVALCLGAVATAFVVSPGVQLHRRSGLCLSSTTDKKKPEEKVDYASMTAEALQEELRAAHNKMFEMNLEKWQSKRKGFKAHDYRDLKRKIARIMPIYEEKAAAAAEAEEASEEATTEETTTTAAKAE